MYILAHRIMDESMGDALVIKINSGTRRGRHQGVFFLGRFIFWTSKKEVPRRSGRNQYYDKTKILQINKVRLSGGIFLLNSRLRENDES